MRAIHEGEKCSKSFTRRYNLRAHVKIIHLGSNNSHATKAENVLH